jgi:hypothetical protein
MAYTLDIGLALGTSKAGLTDLRAQLVDTAGASVGGPVSTGFSDQGQGCYLWHYASWPDGHRGGVKFYSNASPSVTLAFAAINPEEGENLDVKVSSRLPANVSSAVTVTGPVAEGGEVEIVKGDDYAAADGRALEWTSTTWPNLTGATITFRVLQQIRDDVLLTKAGSVVTPTGTAKVRVELTAAETGALSAGGHRFEVVATLSSGRVATLVRDTFTVQGETP